MTDRYHLLDIKELAGAIHKSVRWIGGHLDEIPHIRLGAKLLFRPSEIDKWLDQYREVEEYDPIVSKVEQRFRRHLKEKGGLG